MIQMKFKLVFCHRIPERTFKIGNRYFPVCVRCTGIYLGMIFFLVISFNIKLQYGVESLFIGLLMNFPAFLDGFTQISEDRISNNGLRFFTGLLSGIGVVLVIQTILIIILN